MVTDVEAATGDVVTLNVADVAPCGMKMLAGTAATAAFDDDSVTVAPLCGAAPVSVAVPVAAVPPVTVPGEMVMVESLTGAACAATENSKRRNAKTHHERRMAMQSSKRRRRASVFWCKRFAWTRMAE